MSTEGYGSLRFHIGTREYEVAVSPLEIASIFASSRGFFDLDLEPKETGFKLTATARDGSTAISNGRTVAEACKRLVEAIDNDRAGMG